MRAETVVQVLHGLFYVLLQLLVVDAIILSFKFYCVFYCSCDLSYYSFPCAQLVRQRGVSVIQQSSPIPFNS